MEIVQWLVPSDAKQATAVVRVEPGHVADVEQMLILLDGNSLGNFGITVELIKTGDAFPLYRPLFFQGRPVGDSYLDVVHQHGFGCAREIRSGVRYYRVRVARD